MATMTVEQFVNATIQWGTARNPTFKLNWPVKGGWEGWVQVDLTGFILSVDPTCDILREYPIFTSPYMRTDLLLNSTAFTDAQIPVEIKAESFENRMDPFLQGILKDIQKLNEDRNTDFSECTCIMMAIPFSPQSAQAVLSIQEGGHNIFTLVYVGEVAIAIAVYTEAGGWIPARQASVSLSDMTPEPVASPLR
ncbi:hypothetical protein V5E97_01625 [Singulisphaera sp. Ch08]|uniref:Uncharacterized protein n=1 Tax=Singulisphaera sp. Ch08 TaxID=3120278 RepID=A0AAU7CJD2_9BACT